LPGALVEDMFFSTMQNAKLGWYLNTVVTTQLRPTASPLVSDAMDRIGRAASIPHAQALQLLALRRYLRLQNRENRDLASLWSWTAAQVGESLGMLPSEDGTAGVARRVLNEAARVQQAFALANPGYTLAISPPRDLDRQVALWTSSLDARVAGRDLFERAVKRLSQPIHDLPAELARVVEFSQWLGDARVLPEPGNAAPGTSDHGQMRAVDFIVMQGRRIVASTERATIATQWTVAGWTARLPRRQRERNLSDP
jgi:hypothetical protein